ncbi:MAG: hypothetical protein EON58_02515 [Alphaproteobacteria bacterium]|nr:MAG: hypothetical protein EON58_02515 [Alphaproteobacteria bacterium]
MPVTNYRTLNGRMRGQTTSGVRTDYLTDALGSVTATVTASATVENTYRHKPYGERLTKTGTGVDPRFLWTGDTGSRTTGASHAEQYNRARHYGAKQANWTSVDPMWPEELAYAYVDGNPTTWIDPSGMDPRCSCELDAPPLKGIVHGHPRGRKAQCYKTACDAYGKTLEVIGKLAVKECPMGANNLIVAKRTNSYYPPANLIDFDAKVCNDLFVGEDVPFGVEGGADANKSQWPVSKPQIHGPKGYEYIGTDLSGEFCLVECRVRVCYWHMSNMRPESVLKRRLNACDEGFIFPSDRNKPWKGKGKGKGSSTGKKTSSGQAKKR